MFITRDKALDDNAAAFIYGNAKGGAHFLFGEHVGEHAAAMIAVGGFNHHGQADILCGSPGFVGCFDHLTLGYGNATGLEQTFGQIFITRNGFGNGAGLICLGGPDTPLLGTVAQLHQIVFGQAHGGDLALHGGIDNATGARTKQAIFGQILEGFNGGGNIVGFVFNRGHDQVAAGFNGQAGDFIVQVVHDHFVNAAPIGFAGTTKTTRDAGQAEELQRDMFHNVRRPGAFVQTAHKTAVFFVTAPVFH